MFNGLITGGAVDTHVTVRVQLKVTHPSNAGEFMFYKHVKIKIGRSVPEQHITSF